ncbi:hypothetical protein AB0911_08140 [Streptomyces nigra]|uniref:hypothetical protein n=1 Tax=Streptomyces nigra TaxID=1827580 RepID=UPI0034572E12
MTRAECIALLGPETAAKIRARVAQAPDPSDELVEDLRRIMTRPAGEIPERTPAADAA